LPKEVLVSAEVGDCAWRSERVVRSVLRAFRLSIDNGLDADDQDRVLCIDRVVSDHHSRELAMI